METKKIAKVEAEISKAKEKLAEWQAKLRDLERHKTELENTEIVDIVRGLDISLTDLADLLKQARAAPFTTSGQFGPKSAPGPKDEPDTDIDTDKEDSKT